MKNRWAILFLLFISRLGMGFQFQSISSVGDHLSIELGFSQTEIGALIGFFIFPGIAGAGFELPVTEIRNFPIA